MPATTKKPLGDSVLASRWYLDVSSTGAETPSWTGVFGITEFVPTYEDIRQDVSDFDSAGAKSSQKTAYSWGVEATVRRATTLEDSSVYDPGQEILRIASISAGPDNRVYIRFYEMNGPGQPLGEAYEGWVSVDFSDEGGDMEADAKASLTLHGFGKRTEITHPNDDGGDGEGEGEGE